MGWVTCLDLKQRIGVFELYIASPAHPNAQHFGCDGIAAGPRVTPHTLGLATAALQMRSAPQRIPCLTHRKIHTYQPEAWLDGVGTGAGLPGSTHRMSHARGAAAAAAMGACLGLPLQPVQAITLQQHVYHAQCVSHESVGSGLCSKVCDWRRQRFQRYKKNVGTM